MVGQPRCAACLSCRLKFCCWSRDRRKILGGLSGQARPRCRTDSLCTHLDVKRIRLDRPDVTAGPRAHQSSEFLPMDLLCETTAPGPLRLRAGTFWLRWKRRYPSTLKSSSTVRCLHEGS